MQAAVVVELTHLATLYHDDVMDSAPYRRGAPTAHEVWGNSVAILTGDLIFARASILVSELGGEALGIQARTFERLCLGQLHETVGPREDEDALEHYLSVIADKTGSLVAASGQLGALFADTPQEVIDVMVAYGEKVGVAFQLADDVIDVTGLKVKSGKAPGTAVARCDLEFRPARRCHEPSPRRSGGQADPSAPDHPCFPPRQPDPPGGGAGRRRR